MRKPFVFTRIYLPRPIDRSTPESLIRRLTASDAPRPLAFEVRASDTGVQYLLACTPTSVQSLKRLISNHAPGVAYGPANRSKLTTTTRIAARQRGLPMSEPDVNVTGVDILGALDARKPGESVALQVVLGRSRSAEVIRGKASDPFQGALDAVLHGVAPALHETQRRLATHAKEPRLEVSLRIGVDAATAERRKALTFGVFGALQRIESAGVSLRLNREPATRLEEASHGRPGFLLTPSELVPLLAWPIGEADYPGLDPIHPKRIPVPKSVTSKECVFAVGTAPGPTRPVGIDAHSRLSHLGVLAPTGSGKSEAILAPLILADIRKKRPVVLVDPKSQLVEYILDCLTPDEADRVVIFDPSDPEGTAGLNPLDIGQRDPYVAADSIMAVFKSVFAAGWGPRTEDILHASVLTLLIDAQRNEKPHTLLDLPRLLTDEAFRRSVIGAVRHDAEVARFWGRFEAMSPSQREHEIAAPMNKLRRYLMRRGVTAVLGQARPAFRLADIFKGSAIVLVAVNEALGGAETSRLVGGLVCSEVFMAAQERALEKDPQKRPGFVYVDEVAKFLSLPMSISSALEISRSYGVGWALFGQGHYQLNSDLAQAIEINTRSKVTFATSPSEAKAIAKQAPNLTAEDVQMLPRFNVYMNVQTKDGQSGWFSAKTLSPPERLGHGKQIREAARQRHGQGKSMPPETAEDPTSEATVPSSHQKRRRV